jgi:hypothetical protein
MTLRLGKFAIQSGANLNFGTGPSMLKYTYIQVPALLGFKFQSDDFSVGIFGGPVFNLPLSASSTVSFTGSSDGLSQEATMTIPISGMVSGEVGAKMKNLPSLIYFIGFQYTFDFGETTVKLADGHEGSFYRSSFGLSAGLKLDIPFKR